MTYSYHQHLLKVLVTLYVTAKSMTMTRMMPSECEAYSIIVGLNPALQKRFILSNQTPTLVPGNVHRASTVQEGIGGKGQDVAVTLACLSLSPEKSYVHLAQFLGMGAEGDLALSKLNQAQAQALVCDSTDSSTHTLSLTIRTKAKLRTCTTIIANDSATELVEPSGDILPLEIQLLKEKLEATISNANANANANEGVKTKIRGICIMGSMPPGCSETLYAELYATIVKQHPRALCVIDTVVGLKPLLEQMKSSHSSGGKHTSMHMLKINLAELYRLANIKVSSETSSSMASLEQMESALSGFFDAFADVREALDYIAITNGCHPAHLICIVEDTMRIIRLHVPDLSLIKQGPAKVYPIGAGDSVAAGTLAAWEYLETLSTDDDIGTSTSTRLERLDGRIQSALKRKCDDIDTSGDDDRAAVTSFAFGIACGSASCVKEENSVLDIVDALTLLEQVKIESIC